MTADSRSPALGVILADIQASIAVKQVLLADDALHEQLAQLAQACLAALRAGGKVIFAGNGGSFADAQHLSAEFTSRFMFDRAPLASLALGTNNSAISAIGNDYGYELVFARELQGIARPGDIFVPISTSGNSANILAAVKTANDLGIATVAWTGATGGQLKALANVFACHRKKQPASRNATSSSATFFVALLSPPTFAEKTDVSEQKKKRVVLIIQARMGSTRLPGKSMMDLAGAPLVGRILERVKRCKRVDEIVLATPDTPENQILLQLGRDYGVTVFAGAENDLVDRYYQAALATKADIIGRLPADNATPEPSEIDRIVDHHLSLGRPGFSSNLTVIGDSGYPDGIGAEMFDFSLLSDARERHTDPRQREHVHLNFFNYTTQRPVDSAWCPVSTVSCPAEFRRPDLVLDVNTQAQYDFMRELYEYLYPGNPDFHITDTIRWFDTVYVKPLQD